MAGGSRDSRKRTAAPPSSAAQQDRRRMTAVPESGRRGQSTQQRRPRAGTAEQIQRQQPGSGNQRQRQPEQRSGDQRQRPADQQQQPQRGGGQQHTVEDRQTEGQDNSPEFLEQLQAWANRTATRDVAELEREFNDLQRAGRPQPSADFTRCVFVGIDPTFNLTDHFLAIRISTGTEMWRALTTIGSNWQMADTYTQTGSTVKGSDVSSARKAL